MKPSLIKRDGGKKVRNELREQDELHLDDAVKPKTPPRVIDQLTLKEGDADRTSEGWKLRAADFMLKYTWDEWTRVRFVGHVKCMREHRIRTKGTGQYVNEFFWITIR